MPYAQGRTEIQDMRGQIERATSSLQAAGKIASMPPWAAAEAAIDELFSDPTVQEPTTFAGRRHILEGILDLKATYNAGDLVIEGQIPMAPMESIGSGKEKAKQKCIRRPDTSSISTVSIPFILKNRVA